MKLVAFVGFLVGGGCALLSWSQNVRGHESVFPDLMSAMAPALLVALAFRILAKVQSWRSASAMRRAGLVLVGAGALPFVAGHMWMIQLRLPGFPPGASFSLALSGFLLMGGLGVWFAFRRPPRFGVENREPQPNKPLQPSSGADKPPRTWEIRWSQPRIR
jgi:uncharacterized membrane protein